VRHEASEARQAPYPGRIPASPAAAGAAAPVTGVRERVAAWLPLGAILLAFAIISTAYNLGVPLYEAPDEAAHARYVQSIASEGELPRLRSAEEYESWQPPLFYAVGAAALKLLALDSPPNLEWNPGFPSQKNNYLHTSDEDWPYSEPVKAAHVLRGISMLFGAGTLVFIYLAALVIFPARRLLALSAAATAGLIPQFAFIASTISNDAASVFFAAATVYFGLRHLRDGDRMSLLAAGLMLSLGALSKLTAVVTVVVPAAAVLYHQRLSREALLQLGVLAVIPAVLAGWFYIRSLILWGDFFPSDRLPWLDPDPIWDPSYRTIFLDHLRESFWYVGGAFNVRLDPIVYNLLDFACVLAIAGLIACFITSRFSRKELRAVPLLLVLPVLALATVLYFSVTEDFQTQGRYLFVAMPAFAILLPLGIGALFTREGVRDHPVMLALPLLLIVINVGVLAKTLPATY
jgi:hypothetical protein